MKRVTRVLWVLVVTAGLLIGCAAKRSEVAPVMEQEAPAVAAGERGAFGGTDATTADESKSSAASTASSGLPSERMIVRTVNMSVVVEDTDVALTAIREMVASYKGYIAESNRWLVDEQPRAYVTLRIPADKLDEALDSLRSAAIRVESESSSGQDVTEEYYDVDARLRNLEAAETELLAMLADARERGGKADDILAIYREITSIRGQIETLQGRKTYLSQMSSLATVTVQITPKAKPGTVVEKSKWSPAVTANRAMRAFVRVFQVLTNLLIYVLILSPFIGLPVLIIWLIARSSRRRKASRTQAAARDATKADDPDQAR